MLGLPEGDTDLFFDSLVSTDGQQDVKDGGRDQQQRAQGAGSDADGADSSDGGGSDGGVGADEPPELRAARSALAAYSARPGEEEPAGGSARCTHACVDCWKQAQRVRSRHACAG